MLNISQIKLLESKNIFKYLKETSPEWYKNWETIANSYEKTINRGPYFTNIAFAPHDFENHCMDIYKIIDSLIQTDKLGKVINVEEVFVLLVAVILHDIIMAYNPDEREVHSEKAKQYVIEQVYSKNDSILKNCLTRNQAQAVGWIILGHSDLKKEEKIDTLAILPGKGSQPEGTQGEINVRSLAAILRLADELDVTNMRVNGIAIEKYKINEESEIFWNQCNLFKAVRPYFGLTTVIKLDVDEIAYENSGDNIKNIKCIRNVKNKIQDELNNVNRILTEPGYYDGWTLSKVEVNATQEILDLLNEYENKDPFEDDDIIEEKKKF